MLVGNHDGISSMNPDENKTYNSMYAYTRDYVERNGKTPYGYMDFKDRKIRCVFLSTTTYSEYSGYAICGFGWEQMQWVAKEALNTEDGWHVLVFSHYCPYDPNLEGFHVGNLIGKEIIKMLNAYNTHTAYRYDGNSGGTPISVDYSSHTATKTVAWVCGHGHYDRVTTDNTYLLDYDLCCPIIHVACARLEQENEIPDDNNDGVGDGDIVAPARKTKTVTQDLWDTLIYDPTANLITMVRFGAGEDREVYL